MPTADSAPPYPFVLTFKVGVILFEQAGERWLQAGTVKLSLSQAPSIVLTMMRLLAATGVTESQLIGLITPQDGDLGLSKLLYYLRRVAQLGWLCYTVSHNGRPLATTIPLTASYQFTPITLTMDQQFTLSRFAYMRMQSGQMVVESPLGHAQIVISDWQVAAFVYALAQLQNLSTLGQLFPGWPAEVVVMLLNLFISIQALQTAEAISPQALTQWSFHDLLFHSRSRLGRHDNPYGGTYRFLDQIKPEPVVKPPMSDEIVDLFKPDLEALKREDVPFTTVVEDRRSLREHGTLPLTLKEVGEFLYRTARIRTVTGNPDKPQYSDRPYPSGGASYELELYLVVHQCQNLAAGSYHYQPQAHQLHRLSTTTETRQSLLMQAGQAAGQNKYPQILIILAARFQSVAWKYDSLAYALILKHVGVLFQTMYLVATAMKLAPCALGGGNSDLFAAAVGLDYYTETSVGEFILGSRPDEAQP